MRYWVWGWPSVLALTVATTTCPCQRRRNSWGALLVLTMTLGFVLTDLWLA